MTKFKFIHVGLGGYSLQRLQILLNMSFFEPVAFVDIDIHNKIENLQKLNNLPSDYSKRIFTTISEAIKKYSAEVCFIFVASDQHPKLINESLQNDLHTYCVKAIALDLKQFQEILKIKKRKKNKILVQGLNGQWSEASQNMQSILKSKNIFGEFKTGFCTMWGRQQLLSKNAKVDVMNDGSFFHSMACHQICQIVPALGLPEHVYCGSVTDVDNSLGYTGIERTSTGNIIFEYENGSFFSYTGVRSAHGNPYGFASRWSGKFLFHGSKADLLRDGGRVTIFQNGNTIQDHFFKDTESNQIQDDHDQFHVFYKNLVAEKNFFDIQKSSLETWILMECCNISSKTKKKLNVKNFIKEINFYQCL